MREANLFKRQCCGGEILQRCTAKVQPPRGEQSNCSKHRSQRSSSVEVLSWICRQSSASRRRRFDGGGTSTRFRLRWGLLLRKSPIISLIEPLSRKKQREEIGCTSVAAESELFVQKILWRRRSIFWKCEEKFTRRGGWRWQLERNRGRATAPEVEATRAMAERWRRGGVGR